MDDAVRALRGRQPRRRPAQPDDAQLGDAGVVRAEAGRHRRREARGDPRAGRPRAACSACDTIDREDRAIVRKFTKPVEVESTGATRGTVNGFPFHAGVTGAPILDQAAAWFDCEVRQAVDVGDHTFFIGEVVACGFQKDEDTPVLRMEDTRMNYGG